eukprot:m.45886 g.45886  ORF g.45886 m.45886 type:complete len:149 (-) comp15146_c0_seq5:253-699(-)
MPIRFAVSFHVFSDASCYSGDTTAGTLLYTVGSELFFTENAESVQKQTLRDIENHPEVIERLGTGLTALGAPTHAEYKVEDMLYLRMKFLVHGASGQGTVQLEVKKKQSGGKFRFRYLFVDVAAQGLAPSRRIVLEDNRADDANDRKV